MSSKDKTTVDEGDHGDKEDYSLLVKCPLCRAENKIDSSQKPVKGIETQCVVCKDNLAQLYFPQCGHVCVCQSCSLELNENQGSNQLKIVPQSRLHQSVVCRALTAMKDHP